MTGKRKRCSALFAGILIIAVILAACGGGQSTTPPTDNNGGATAAPAAPSGGSQAAAPAVQERLVITYSAPGVDAPVGENLNSNNLTSAYVSERFNIEFDYIPVTFNDWDERMRIWISSNDLPDLSCWRGGFNDQRNYAEQGLLKALPGDWRSRWPNVAAAFDKAAINTMMEERLGGVYSIGRPIFSLNAPADKLGSHNNAYLRQDWADAVGYPLKDAMTINEIYEYLKLVKEQNPGNVDGNFYPFVMISRFMEGFVQFAGSTHAASTQPFYKGDDGLYQWGAASEDTLEVLRVLYRMYTEELLHPEFYTYVEPDEQAEFHTIGRAAMTFFSGMALHHYQMDQNMQQHLGLRFGKEGEGRPVVILGNDGQYHFPGLTNVFGYQIFSPNISDEKLERILNLFDWAATEEGQLTILLGIEGEEWHRGADGKIEMIDSTYAEGAVSTILGQIFLLTDDFQFTNPSLPEEHRNHVKDLYQLRARQSTDKTFPRTLDWDVMFHSSPARNQATFNYSDEYVQLIIMPGDIEANWRAWVADKMPMVQPVLDELNAL